MKNKRRFMIIAGVLVVLSASILILTFAIPGKEQLPVFNNFFNNKNISMPIPLTPAVNVIFSPDMYLQMGYDNLQEGKYEDAIVAYQKAAEVMPGNEDVFYNLGVSYLKAGKVTNAVKAYQKAAKIKDSDSEIRYNLGVSYSQLRLWRKAIKEYKRATELNPFYVNAFYNMGIAYGRLSEWNNAITAFKKLIKINHTDIDARYNLALIGLIINDKNLVAKQCKALKHLSPGLASKIVEIQSKA